MITWHHCDLLDSESVSALVSSVRPSHLLHLAWYVSPADYQESLRNVEWVQASIGLAEAFADNGGQRSVMVGTCFEYEWTGSPLTEGVTALRPVTLYGACKSAVHLVSEALLQRRGVLASWAHLFYLYGPGENESRLVPAAIRSMLDGEPFECAQPLAVRDYMHIEDTGDALAALVDSAVEGDVNVASGEPTSLGDLVSIIATAIGRPELSRCACDAPPSGPAVVGSVARLKGEVGWTPKFDLNSGIEDAANWWRREMAGS